MSVESSRSPFDVLADAQALLDSCGFESVHGVADADHVEKTVRELAEPFAGLSREQAAGFVRAIVIGWLSAMARNARLAEEWKSQILTVAGNAYEAGTMEPSAYNALLLLCTNSGLVAPESAWPIH